MHEAQEQCVPINYILCVVLDWIRALPIKWTDVGPRRDGQRHVCHNVLLLACSHGNTYNWCDCFLSLAVSIFFPKSTENVVSEKNMAVLV